jgi:hypothetical protein
MKIQNNILLALLTSAIALTGCGQGNQTTNVPRQEGGQQQAETTSESKTASEVYEGTVSGVISDSMCGADHSKMGELGKNPEECTKKCVEQGAKYVLLDEQGQTYALSDQDKAGSFAAKAVTVKGHIDPATKSIHVHSLAAK